MENRVRVQCIGYIIIRIDLVSNKERAFDQRFLSPINKDVTVAFTPVAQWIELWPPEPGARVRVPPGVPAGSFRI